MAERASDDAARIIATDIEDAGLAAAVDRTFASWQPGVNGRDTTAPESARNPALETPEVT